MFRLNSAAAKLAKKACLDVEAATGSLIINRNIVHKIVCDYYIMLHLLLHFSIIRTSLLCHWISWTNKSYSVSLSVCGTTRLQECWYVFFLFFFPRYVHTKREKINPASVAIINPLRMRKRVTVVCLSVCLSPL